MSFEFATITQTTFFELEFRLNIRLLGAITQEIVFHLKLNDFRLGGNICHDIAGDARFHIQYVYNYSGTSKVYGIFLISKDMPEKRNPASYILSTTPALTRKKFSPLSSMMRYSAWLPQEAGLSTMVMSSFVSLETKGAMEFCQTRIRAIEFL